MSLQYLISSLLFGTVFGIENDSITFRIPDGTKKNSYIGNLPQNANFASNSDLRKFKLVTGDGNLITVSPFIFPDQTHF